MKIITAKHGGFCRGVQKAVQSALTIDANNAYVYGEIIHNPEVVKAIAERGVLMVEDLGDVPNGATLLIRSHGVGKSVYDECQRRDIKL